MTTRWRFHIGQGMFPDADGAYVDWPDYRQLRDDYAKLASENAKLREAHAVMSSAYSNMGAVIDALRRQIDGDTSRETAPD